MFKKYYSDYKLLMIVFISYITMGIISVLYGVFYGFFLILVPFVFLYKFKISGFFDLMKTVKKYKEDNFIENIINFSYKGLQITMFVTTVPLLMYILFFIMTYKTNSYHLLLPTVFLMGASIFLIRLSHIVNEMKEGFLFFERTLASLKRVYRFQTKDFIVLSDQMYSDNNRVQYSENYVYTQYDFYFYNGNAMMKDEEIRLSHLLKYCEISDRKINEFSVDDFNLVAMVNI